MKTLATLLAVAAMSATGASAQQPLSYGLETGISTLGAYVAPDFAINDRVHVRVPLYFAG